MLAPSYVRRVDTFVSFSGVSQAENAAKQQENCNQKDDDNDDKQPPHVSQAALLLCRYVQIDKWSK